MLRPGLVIVLPLLASTVVGAGPARAGEVGRTMGMYSKAGAALPMLDSKVEITVRGPIVETIVTQKFENRTDRATEATYIFPLPVDAAVSAMAIHYGARTIRGAIETRDRAQVRYEAAVRAGVAAAVLDQERPDVFTQTVTAVPAHGAIEVTLRYDAVARFSAGTWELTLPMVVAPRYVPGAATGRPTSGTGRSPDTERAPDASRVTPGGAPGAGGPTRVTIHFDEAIAAVTSPTHELIGGKTDASFVDPRSDHDAIVRWQTSSAAAGWVEASADGGYAAVVVAAPPPGPRAPGGKILLVLSRAATMRGDADAVTRPLVRALLGALDGSDRISVIGSDRLGWSAPADAMSAIDQAWSRPPTAFDLTRQLASARTDGASIVLISDGLVADDRAVVMAASSLGVSIHVIGVGPAPARGLLTEIAGTTGGTIRFAIPGDDVTVLAKAVVFDATTAAAPLTVNWGTLVAREVVPGRLPRLGTGQAMVVLARIKRAQAANARARGELFAIEPIQATRGLGGATTTAGPLARRWARGRLDELLVGPRNESAVTAHALHYGLVSPYTSLVAIGDEVVVQGGVKHTVAVPVSVPAGMHWARVKAETTADGTVESTTRRPAAKTSGARPAEVDAPANRRPATRAEAEIDLSQSTKGQDAGSQGEDDADHEESRQRALGAPRSSVATLGAPMKQGSAEAVALHTSEAARRGFRLTAALGGGVTFQDHRRGLVSLGTRLEFGDRTLLGVEGSVWLVSASRLEGQALLTLARRGIARWFELGAGLGLHVGEEAGPGASLSLRGRVPRTQGAGYLRYDGALLTRDGVREAQSALTLGIEWGF